MRFDVLNQTLACTNFGELHPGSLVNLERPLRADGRLDGHFVQGHADATGVVRRWEKSGTNYVLEVTVLGRNWVRCWIIPHTHAITNLLTRRGGASG